MKPWILALSLFIVFLSAICSTSNPSLITSTCNTTSLNNPNIDYTFCLTSLQGSPCTTLQGLGKFAMELILWNVTDTSCHIERMMKTGGWDQYVGQCLSDCLELFSDARSSVEEALSCYEHGRFDDANVKITSVMDAAVTCEDGFKERRGVISPLTKRNDDAFQLSAIALSVMHMVQTRFG